jgi:hypothetical protein
MRPVTNDYFGPIMKILFLIGSSLILVSGVVRAGDDAGDKIRAANVKNASEGMQMKETGYTFYNDLPDVLGTGDHICSHLRDEVVDGEPAAVYREQYKANAGSTDATIWISKISGRLLREEQDGNIAGKGKGHISYRWTAPKQ